MLRRIPTTSLVCLAFFLSTIVLNAAWAAGPDESLEILLRPNQPGAAPVTASHRAKSRARSVAPRAMATVVYPCVPPPVRGITKVKPAACAPVPYGVIPRCFLPAPRARQWDISAQALFARVKGTIAWPRYSQFFTSWNGYDNQVDLNDDLMLPAHQVIPELNVRYQFRPHWGVQYSILGYELNGGGWPNRQFVFGPGNTGFIYFGQNIQTKWQHTHQRLSLVYDALRNCQASVSVSGGWVHVDDKISISCQNCGNYTSTFSKGIDAAVVGLQFQRCLKTAANGGTISLDNKVSAMFIDDVEGWDVQAGARYSVPLGCGRWGYLKGGYRFVQLKKGQYDYLLNSTLEGGFVEGGFIF